MQQTGNRLREFEIAKGWIAGRKIDCINAPSQIKRKSIAAIFKLTEITFITCKIYFKEVDTWYIYPYINWEDIVICQNNKYPFLQDLEKRKTSGLITTFKIDINDEGIWKKGGGDNIIYVILLKVSLTACSANHQK